MPSSPLLVQLVLSLSGVLFLVGALGTAAHRRASWRIVVYGATFLSSVVFAGAALHYLLVDRAPQSIELPVGLPQLHAHFAVDALSSAFLIVVGIGGAIASLYAIGYGRHEEEPARVLPLYPVFVGAMPLVLLSADAFSFLFSWELMSLSSWGLVVAHHRNAGNVLAGYVYLIMAAFGTLALLLAFGLLAGANAEYDFATMRVAAKTDWLSGAVLLLALIGAGSKAGVVPLHAWLPLAHPAAPSHVSALLSGVMTKVAVYGFVRIVFDLLPTPSSWWALVVLTVAGATALLGVLYALMQHDLKRLLAYHTVENIGIIFIGLGLALAFEAHHLEWAAALAFTAALFHVLNHSLFKSLLFFGAGAVLSATGQRDMEKLGGLIRTMPITALMFLVGSAAISALPPLNGFVSEWLTFQAILLSPQLPDWGLKLLVPSVGGLLALSAALAAACFVKAFGVTFLGRPRSAEATAAHEVDRFSLTAMAALVALCVLCGIFPGFVIDALSPVAERFVGAPMPLQADQPWFAIVPIEQTRSSYNGLVLLGFIVLTASVFAYLIHRLASDDIRRAPAWDCGYPEPSPQTQYTATSFAQPIRRVFGTAIFRARERIHMPPPGDSSPARAEVTLVDPAWRTFYVPVVWLVDVLSERANVLQTLTIRQYLGLVFLALLALLVVVAIWP
jgi:formate hydrogenlyase subunit 3/multisubunit Na+/H+ antiporter MnhD subunit